MARAAKGLESIEQARAAIAAATTVEQLRQAQALVLPLEHGLSLEATARMIGLSVGWTSRLRNAFLRGEVVGDGSTPPRGGGFTPDFTDPYKRAHLPSPHDGTARNGGAGTPAEDTGEDTRGASGGKRSVSVRLAGSGSGHKKTRKTAVFRGFLNFRLGRGDRI